MKGRYLTLLPLLMLTACSIHQRVDKVMGKVEEQYAQTKTWDELPLRVISWQQAISMMQRNNADLKRIRDTISESERNELSVYTQMIPSVSYYGSLNSTIEELTKSINNQRLNSNINVGFSIPTLTQVPYRVYASKATTYANKKALEGKERELTAALYRIVRTAEVKEKQKALQDKTPQEGMSEKPVAFRNTDTPPWSEVAAIVGDNSARWVVQPDSMPHVRWEVYEPKLGKLDPLVVCQFALRLEQARMAQYSIALRYLPTINTSLYSPSLFTSTGGTYQGTFLSSEDTRINLSISYSLDTDMDLWNSYKRNKDNYERTKQDVENQLRDYRNKLQKARTSYADYQTWLGFIHKRMDYLKKTPVVSADAFIERQKEILSMEKELLNQEMMSIETESSLILQYGLLTH